MKLLMFIFIAVFEVYSFASEYQFGGNVVCNTPNKISINGIPNDACFINAQHIAVGISPQDGAYFFDVLDGFVSIDDATTVNLRFIFPKSHEFYNQIQAITQTAFGTRAQSSIIFKNPNVVGANCYRYANTGNLVCSLLAIEIFRN